MMDKSFLKELEAFANTGGLVLDEPLCNHTTFRVGGRADAFLSVSEEEQLQKVIALCKRAQVPYLIIGNGSNLLVSDAGFRGLVLAIGKGMSEVCIEQKHIIAKAGALLSSVAQLAAKNGLGGMEFASGIPGSIGGAIVMNAGAYDGEMKQIVEEVTVLTQDGDIKILTNDELDFGYRMSRVKKEQMIVLSVKLCLEFKEQELIYAKMNDFAARRREKQPLEYPSAGSTFKRPEGMFAGKLIMDAGLRGYTVGGAQVSQKHCGFVINTGNATAEDVYTLIKDVQNKVNDTFGVMLEPEVIMVGDF